MTGAVEVLKMLPKRFKDVMSWVAVLGLLLSTGFVARAAVVDRDEFRDWTGQVAQNTSDISDLFLHSEIQLCLELSDKEGFNHGVCLDRTTRRVYLNTLVEDLPVRED